MAGHCVDGVTGCASLHLLNPTAASGFYTLLDNTQIYCDMNHPQLTYQELGLGEFDMTYAGYERITMTEFADPAMQQVFIALYNHQAGARTMAGFVTSGNCCIKQDDTPTKMLVFGVGNYLTPATAPSTIVCSSYVVGTSYTVALMEDSTKIQASLPATFFTANPPALATFCSDATNPAFFWKRHP